ncbi:hypothetical protein [Pseudoalteromonas sp. ASV78]|uniref:hypothetical protein n=1 Tax=Pseudoalteromonas sp. ASV78 TaxID=3397851 RepID=UPI0039FC8493
MTDYGTRNESTVDDRDAAESVKQRVFLAVQELCIGKGDVRSRLIVAIDTLSALNSNDFPKALVKDFEWVIKESKKYESDNPGHKSDLEFTMGKIYNSTGKKIAEKIFKMYSDIQNIRGFPLLGGRKSSE